MPSIPDDHTSAHPLRRRSLIRVETLRRLVAHVDDKRSRSSGEVAPIPTGYGRVVRDNAGNIFRIVEHKDASMKERAINEGNTGILAAPARLLRSWLAALKNDNAQGEYYLTDVILMAVKQGCRVAAGDCSTETEVLGVNDKVQLAELEAVLRKERATQLMLQGATLADPARIDIRGEVTVGKMYSLTSTSCSSVKSRLAIAPRSVRTVISRIARSEPTPRFFLRAYSIAPKSGRIATSALLPDCARRRSLAIMSISGILWK